MIFKGLIQWLYDLIINITQYLSSSLLDIFNMDLSYFETTIPITSAVVDIMIVTGWALLLGNLVFQAMKSMVTGLGFEGEDPKTLFGRTFVMGFLLLGSRQICDIGLGITKKVIDMLQVPDVVQIPQLSDSFFDVPGDASWLLAVIIGVILVIQIIKLFFEIGERYVIVAVLTILSPLAFAMGGSKNTADIFKGWVRMFASMCLMMVLSVLFLKFILSAMSVVPKGVAIIPWTVFIVALARMGRKIDGIVARIGLNPAITGDPLGHSRFPGMLSYMVIRNMAGSIGKAAAASKGSSPSGKSGASRPAPVSNPSSYGTSSPGAGASPLRPPIGSSGTKPDNSSTQTPFAGSAKDTTAPFVTPTGGSNKADGSIKSAETATHRDSRNTAHAPALTTGSELGGLGVAKDTTALAGRPPLRPPIGAQTETNGRTATAKSTDSGARAAAGRPEAVKSSDASAGVATQGKADSSGNGTARPSAARPAINSLGTHSADKPAARPITKDATLPDKTGREAIKAAPSVTLAKGTATGTEAGIGTRSNDIKGAVPRGTDIKDAKTKDAAAATAAKPSTPVFSRPFPDIKSANAAKGGTVPPRGESASAGKEGVAEAGKSARPHRPVTGAAGTRLSNGPTRASAGSPQSSAGPKKPPVESRPPDASVINKAGDVNQKGGNVSQNQTSATNVTLQKKAASPGRGAPNAAAAKGGISRPTAGRMPNPSKMGGVSSASTSRHNESAKTNARVNNADNAQNQTVHSKGAPEQTSRGNARESYGNSASRPENGAHGASGTPNNSAYRTNEIAKSNAASGQSGRAAGQAPGNSGSTTAIRPAAAGSATNNTVATDATLSQSGASTSNPPSSSYGTPSRPSAANQPDNINRKASRSDTGRPERADSSDTRPPARDIGKSPRRPQSPTPVNEEIRDRLKNRPPYKPDGARPYGEKRGSDI